MGVAILRRMPALSAAGLLLAAGLMIPAARAQDAAGTWHSTIPLRTGAIRIAVTLKPGADGWQGTILSPEQAGEARPLDEVKASAGRLSFGYKPAGARFDGEWDAAKGAWIGHWTNPLGDIPLTLEKGDIPKGPVVDGLDGVWESALALPTVKLRLVLRVKTGPYGTVALLDSPDQLAMGMPVTTLTRKGGDVTFTLAAIRAQYAGVLSADGQTLVGQFTQGGALPLTFAKRSAPVAARRPQTPAKPYPYREEEVGFDSAPGVRLAGSLTLPPGPGPFPAAVLITGSGAQDRDETLMGHKPFLVLADDLTRRGIAVLRYDDRGVAKSTGDFIKATTEDFAVDAAAAAAFLRTRPEIDSRRVGLIGHSEGGIVAPMVAAREPKTAFIVLMAGVGAPTDVALAAQRAALMPYMGASPERARQNEALNQAIMAATKGAKDSADAEARATVVLLRDGAPLGVTPENVQAIARQFSSAWMRALVAYDPAPNLRAVKAPILALNGTKDLQVIADFNLAGIKAATAANPDSTTVALPGLNHLFQTATTGAVGEYADIEETIAPVALKTIGEWVVARTARR